jgi:hypothetical protein
MSFRILSRIGFLLVIIGFFMPVACEMNGFQIANYMFQSGEGTLAGILIWVLFLAALAGLILGIALLMNKQPPMKFDWLALGVSVVSGLIIYFKYLSEIQLQSGGYVIAVGWVVALVCLLLEMKKAS